MSEAVIHGPGEGERHSAGASSAIIIKATADDTAGSFFLSETTIEPGFPGPPYHRHEQLHDMFYVLDGVLTMRLGDTTHEVGPGTFVCVPPGVAHTFSNTGDAPVRFLNFNTPAGWENERSRRSGQGRATNGGNDRPNRISLRLPTGLTVPAWRHRCSASIQSDHGGSKLGTRLVALLTR